MQCSNRSLLNLVKEPYKFHFEGETSEFSFNETITVDQALETFAAKFDLSASKLSLYLARKNGEPKLSFPAFEKDRLLSQTFEKNFSIVHNKYQNSLPKPPIAIQKQENKKKHTLLRWLGCQ